MADPTLCDSYLLVLFVSVLSRVIILEDELEKLASLKETQSMTAEATLILEEKLRLIQPHVQASNTCWEEALCQVERMVRRPPAIKGILQLYCAGFIFFL